MQPSISNRDTMHAIVTALLASVLFSLRQGVVAGNWATAIMVSCFAIPVAVAITVVFMLPLLALMRRYERSHLAEYMLYPAIAVLFISMIPLLFLSPGLYETLNNGGKRLITNGKLVWSNFGWMILFNMEPALWAGLAGLFFWKLNQTTEASN
jgi:hypothetical protein